MVDATEALGLLNRSVGLEEAIAKVARAFARVARAMAKVAGAMAKVAGAIAKVAGRTVAGAMRAVEPSVVPRRWDVRLAQESVRQVPESFQWELERGSVSRATSG